MRYDIIRGCDCDGPGIPKRMSDMTRLLNDWRVVRRFGRFAACALLFVIGCGPAADRPARGPAEGGLVFVTTLGSAPYAYRDEDTKDYAGIDEDIVRAKPLFDAAGGI